MNSVIFFRSCLLGGLLFLTACESTPMRYHALSENDGIRGASSSGDVKVLVEIAPVSLPDRVDRPEIVAGETDGRVRVLEFDRWAGELSNEIGLVLDRTLWTRLGAANVYQAPLSETAAGRKPYFRLNVSLTRFDAVPGSGATVDGTWTLRRLGGERLAACRFTAVQPLAGESAEEIASSLRQAVGVFAGAVATSMEKLQGGGRTPCAGLERGG